MQGRKKDFLIIVLFLVLIFQTVFIIQLKKQRLVPPPLVKKAKIAIVIDDWGYNLKNLNFIKEAAFPVEISILPFLSYSTKIAEEARSHDLEIILHLPLEPQGYRKVKVEKRVILTTMDKKQVLAILNDALKSVPHVRGISNHMGSKATEDENLMEIIFNEMKKNNLYFLDSYVTPKTVCEKLSKKTNLKFAKRAIFLDNEADPNYIHNQLMSLLDEALKDGEAIGIGHDRELTLKIIKEFIPKIDKDKFEIVFVSDLVK